MIITYYEVTLPPFLTTKEPFCACVIWEVSSTCRIRNMWSSCFIWTRPSFLHRSVFIEFLPRMPPPGRALCYLSPPSLLVLICSSFRTSTSRFMLWLPVNVNGLTQSQLKWVSGLARSPPCSFINSREGCTGWILSSQAGEPAPGFQI